MSTTTQRRFRVLFARDAAGQRRAIRVYDRPSVNGGETLETALAEQVRRIERGVYEIAEIIDGRPVRTRVTCDDPSAP